MTDSNPPDDDPFTEFEDWLVDGPAGQWPSFDSEELSDRQKKIVQKNAKLLKGRVNWSKKVERFEAALATLGNDDAIAFARTDYEIHLDHHVFQGAEHDMARYHFPCSVSFAWTVFEDGKVNFKNAQFEQGVNFQDTIFRKGQVSFNHAKFMDGLIDFGGANFGVGDVDFHGAKFGKGFVRLDEAVFGKGFVSFHEAVFGEGDVSFFAAKSVEGDVSFAGATFGDGDVSFEHAKFVDAKLWFVGLHVRGSLDCTSLKVQRASFRNTTVDGLADWTDAEFRSIPDFRQMKLDRAPEVARMTVPPPRMTGWWPFSKAKDQQDVLKFRKLKAMAIEANDHEKDGEFFAYEMLAKRGWETKGVIGLTANWLYWVLSNYGRSYLVPLCWMALSFVGFAACYAWWLQRYVALSDAAHFSCLFSIKNSIPFLGSLFRSAPVPNGYESRFDTIYQAASGAGLNVDALVLTGVAQSLVGGVFFFFLLLGLRNKFRLK